MVAENELVVHEVLYEQNLVQVNLVVCNMVFELSEMVSEDEIGGFWSILVVFEQNEMAAPEDEKDDFWIFLLVFV